MGLTYDGKKEGLKLLESGLTAINSRRNSNYVPRIATLNAADYGVPQQRERIFIVASIDGHRFGIPPASHGENKPKRSARSRAETVKLIGLSFMRRHPCRKPHREGCTGSDLGLDLYSSAVPGYYGVRNRQAQAYALHPCLRRAR